METQVYREAEGITKLRRHFISKISKMYGVDVAIQAGVLFDESLTMSYIAYRQFGVVSVSGIDLNNLMKKLKIVTGKFDMCLLKELLSVWGPYAKSSFDMAVVGKSVYDTMNIGNEAFNALLIIYQQLNIDVATKNIVLWVQDFDNRENVLNLALAYTREFTKKEFVGHVQRIANLSRDSAIVMLMAVDGLNYAQASTFVYMVRLVNSMVR